MNWDRSFSEHIKILKPNKYWWSYDLTKTVAKSKNLQTLQKKCWIVIFDIAETSTPQWDLNNVTLIDTAIKKSELGLNPQIDGQLIRLPVPDLSEERRSEIKKMIKAMGERCKVSIRNIRREANDDLKKSLKNKDISEDDEEKFEKIIQTYTDEHIKKVDDKVTSKEKEIMTI